VECSVHGSSECLECMDSCQKDALIEDMKVRMAEMEVKMCSMQTAIEAAYHAIITMNPQKFNAALSPYLADKGAVLKKYEGCKTNPYGAVSP